MAKRHRKLNGSRQIPYALYFFRLLYNLRAMPYDNKKNSRRKPFGRKL